jgi:hypothetical protein
LTTSFGYYNFDNLPSGTNYVITVNSKRYNFSPSSQTITLNENLEGIDFVGQLRE